MTDPLLTSPYFCGVVALAIITIGVLVRSMITHDSNPDHWRIRYEELDKAHVRVLHTLTRMNNGEEDEDDDDNAM